MNFNLNLGMVGEKQERVHEDNTAIKYGSGGVAVYATPAMIGLMEGAALNAVDPALPVGLATVGIDLKVKHLAATPVGMGVHARAELLEIDGKRLVFKVEAFDEKEKIGEGTHERFIIDMEKFVGRVASKKGKEGE